MDHYIAPLVVGVICIVLGILNMTGNLSSLHSYHRNHVSEEDRIPFGRRVGLGTLLCGVALLCFGGFSAAAFYTQNQVFTVIGYVVLIAGLIVGLGLSLYAIFKYNKSS